MAILDTRDSVLTYAAGDVIGYVAPLGTTAPSPFADLASPWLCLGWIDTSGYTFKLSETQKEVMAAGTLDPIRTINSAETKTFEATFLEALNPAVMALYDNVPIATVLPDSGTVTTYTFPEIPSDNRYAFVFDSYDGDKRIWNFAPNGKITTRGDNQVQQGDITHSQMTITLYPDTIGSVRSALQKSVDFGSADISAYTS